jgi:hypothetical protein
MVRYGGAGAATTLVAGYFATENGARKLVFDFSAHTAATGGAGTTIHWLEANLQFVASEMASGEPGFETVVSRLADILFVQAARAHLARDGGGCRRLWSRQTVRSVR